MRTMDERQLQKLLTAAAASQQNPMMLFSPMTQPTTTTAVWPLKPQNSLEVNLTALLDANVTAQHILMLQALQNQQTLQATPPPMSTSPFSIASIFPTVASTMTPTPTSPTSSDSVQTLQLASPSVSPKKEEEEEVEDEEEFVDIESVEVAIDGKEKRKAHIEFYRRLKYMRQHFRDKPLTCSVCKKKVENQENAIAVHVAEHAEAGDYQCRLCGWQSVDKYKLFTHMRCKHPRKVEMFVDRRDIPKLCVALSNCFPKTTCRPKKESSNRNADSYLCEILKSTASEKTCVCLVCNAKVRRDKAAIIRHVQTNHTIKCKTCKTISETLDEQLQHQQQVHELSEPKMSVHYAPSAAAVYLLPALEKCFPKNI